jgi:hypothetical protein
MGEAEKLGVGYFLVRRNGGGVGGRGVEGAVVASKVLVDDERLDDPLPP